MTHNDPVDPIAFARELIRCPSVTPEEGGALHALEKRLGLLGFQCHRLPFSEPGTPDVDNLYARIGTQAPHFCFAGHTDVVPVGDRDTWTHDPFAADIQNGMLFGRGACDMKGAVAAFYAAARQFLAKGAFRGSLSFLITGDEEGPAINGTRKMLDWLTQQGESIDDCLVGEPTCTRTLGDTIKIGRRGSLNGWLRVFGAQGHVAYPHLADNPLPRMARMIDHLYALELDEGTRHFQSSRLEATTIDVGNTATNVIPAEARAHFNVRFNTLQTAQGLETRIRETLDQASAGKEGGYELVCASSGEAFLTEPGRLSNILGTAIKETLGITPTLSTGGGTSDARFIKDKARVIEFGLVGQSMHQTDEHARVDDIKALSRIYERLLARYFEGS